MEHMKRIDAILVERDIAFSRGHAKRLIDQGRISVNNKLVSKASQRCAKDADIRVSGEVNNDFVGRGAYKLQGAIQSLICKNEDSSAVFHSRKNNEPLDVVNLIHESVCLDVGASTGGFSDVLLRYGARLVYAVDVGTNQLDERIRTHQNVVDLSQTDIRHLAPLDPLPSFVVADVSYISLTLILKDIVNHTSENATLMLMVKPQFELDNVSRSGVVRDKDMHQKALEKVCRAAMEYRLWVHSVIPAAIMGKKGNQEYFLVLSKDPRTKATGRAKVKEVQLPQGVRKLIRDAVFGTPHSKKTSRYADQTKATNGTNGLPISMSYHKTEEGLL